MNKHLKIVVITIIVMAYSIGMCYPQSKQTRFRHLTAKDGFTSATVNTIYKDSLGFIWLGAFDGLYRYDGYEFKTYKHDPSDPTSLSNNTISNIIEDKNGRLWVGSMWSGLNRYNRISDRFKRYYPNPDTSLLDVNGISCIYQDREGTIWVSTPTGGLHQYIDSLDRFISYKYDTNNPVNFKNFVICMLEDSQGNFWTGTWEGLYIFNRKEKKYFNPDFLNKVDGIYLFNRGKEFLKFEDNIITRNDLQNIKYKDIFEDSSGIHWFTTSIGLLKYDPKLNELIYFESQVGDPNSLSSNTVDEIIEDPLTGEGTLWISSHRGLNQFNKETGENTRYFHDPINSQSLPYSVIHGLHLDNDELLWIGVENSGVSILNLTNTNYEYYMLESKQNKDQLLTATSFYKDQIGFTWVGTNKGGLLKYDQDMNLVDHYYFSGSNFIYSIYETDDGRLITGTLSDLFLFDRPNNEFIHCTLISDNSVMKSARINTIIKDSFGWYWVGSIVPNGLFYQRPDSKINTHFQQINKDPLNHTDIRDFHEDKNGILWVATNGAGIFILKPGNRDSLNFEKFKSSSNNVNLLNTLTIHEDQNGVLWFGGFNGLTRYNPKNDSITIFNSNNGLQVDAIYDIEGEGQYLWLSSDKGLLRFDPIASRDKQVKIMQLSDGIPFEDIYTYDIYRSEEGMIHVGGKRGTRNGFFRFHPNNIKENQHIPPIVITSFQVNNKAFPLDTNIIEKKHIFLKHNQNYFSFEFAALDYVNPEKNQYAYKLEGIDKDWVQSGNRRFINYTGIGSGTYTFRVKGSNNDGIWNEEGISMTITILPPLWKTWWAYSFYVIFIVAILYMIIWFFVRRQRLLHNLKMEQLQSDKLENLDKMKSHFFANISHEFRTPLTLILGPVAKVLTKINDDSIRQDLSMMQRNARRLQNLINQLLSLSRLEYGKLKLQAREDNIVNLVRSYFQSFESLAKQKNIELDFKSDQEIILIYVDQDKLEKILNNLLSNALKFTPTKGRIEVTVLHHTSSVTIIISDTGSGIPQGELPHIFDRFYQANESYTKDHEGTGIGLALAKEMVELHHGEIRVESKEGEGTRFIVTLPLGNEHLKESEIDSGSNNNKSIASVTEPMMVDFQESQPSDPVSETISESDPRPVLLVVEDNADLRVYIKDYLNESYQVLEAINGKDGLDKAIMHIPDLVISDVMMPKMDGMEFCHKLKTDERTSHIPVILLTAKASMEDKLEGLDTGADDFLTKPFDPQELLTRIANLITQRQKLKEKYKSRLGLSEAKEQEVVLSSDDKFLHKAESFVKENLGDPDFSVETFARQMAMSQSQLYRKLKALTDLTPNEMIRTFRLQRAAKLLTHHSGNIAEIAYEVGFNNPSYFSECFQKQFGKLPSEFKA